MNNFGQKFCTIILIQLKKFQILEIKSLILIYNTRIKSYTNIAKNKEKNKKN